jgi:hypothetical protein
MFYTRSMVLHMFSVKKNIHENGEKNNEKNQLLCTLVSDCEKK